MLLIIAGALLTLTNITAFVMMGIDKYKAVRGVRRISEKALLTACSLMAAPGGLLGMYTFHHKTRKPKFSIGVPAMLVAQAALIAAALYIPRG